MNDKDQKLQRILELAKIADALTANQAKQFVELLVGLTNKQKEELVKQFNDFADNVSQETHQKITEAIQIVSEKHKDAMLEVRQMSNKQKKEHETMMVECMSMLEDIKAIEVKDGIDGVNGKDGIDGKDGSPDTALQIVSKLESLEGEDRLDVSAIKGLESIFKKTTQIAKDFAVGGIRFFENLADVSITVTKKRQGLLAQYDTTNKRWQDGVSLIVSTTAPTNPQLNDLWYDIS